MCIRRTSRSFYPLATQLTIEIKTLYIYLLKLPYEGSFFDYCFSQLSA